MDNLNCFVGPFSERAINDKFTKKKGYEESIRD